jgi:hypothetical protein
MQKQFVESGSVLTSLLPRRVSWWQTVMEDIMWSPQITELYKSLQMQCRMRREWKFISLDATLKPCLSLKGQATFRASKVVRQMQALPEREAIYRILTIRGRTGCLMGAVPVQSESSVDIATASEDLAQVTICAVDAPSMALENELRLHCPGLLGLILDAMHLSMKYESVQWKKVTAGSKVLRHILAKFVVVSESLSDTDKADLGPIYNQESSSLVETAHETRVRMLVRSGSMHVDAAKVVLEALDPSMPFIRRVDFVAAIAALVALFPAEVTRRDSSGKMLRRSLWNATHPERVEWLLNGVRYDLIRTLNRANCIDGVLISANR